MPLLRAVRRLRRLGTALPVIGVGLFPWRSAEAQSAATGLMAVRVTVLEPVQPMSLTSAARPPRLERDPVSGAPHLHVRLTTAARVEARVADVATPTLAWSAPDQAGVFASDAQSWRVALPAESRWVGDTLEVRFTTHTGEAETIAIARVSRTALRAALALDHASDFRRGEPGLF